VAAQRGADRGRRHPFAEPQEFTLEALVAPMGVLCGQADDQLLQLLVERRPSWPAVRIGPGAGDQPPMPAQQCLGLDEEARPAAARQCPAERGEQGAVGGLEPGACDLAAEHGELVAQHQYLQVLGGVAASQQDQQLDRAAERQVGEL
jgi:hypothetical protein